MTPTSLSYLWTAILTLLPGLAIAQSEAEPAAPSQSAPAANNEHPKSAFRDPEDGYLDLSSWLLEKKGFLPVPLVITEPAVGNGLGLAALFFSQSMAEAAAQAKTTGHVTPPDIFAVVAAATENGTKFGGAGAMVSFLDDRWRYRGFVGATDVNLTFYGLNETFAKDFNVGYNLQGWFSYQQALYRLGESNNWMSLRWLYLNFDSSFDNDRRPPGLEPHSFAKQDSGIGVSFEHDSRNNIFTPSRGMLAAVDSLFYSPSVGSDNTFQTYRARVFAYKEVTPAVVLAGRFDGRAARGDVPFYQVPYIDMRGIPAARFQGDNVAVAETEVRWNVTPRWGLVGFAGVGRAWGGDTDFGDSTNRFAGGAGFRYQIARILGIWTGIDVAWGPDDEQAFYIQMGSAWR